MANNEHIRDGLNKVRNRAISKVKHTPANDRLNRLRQQLVEEVEKGKLTSTVSSYKTFNAVSKTTLTNTASKSSTKSVAETRSNVSSSTIGNTILLDTPSTISAAETIWNKDSTSSERNKLLRKRKASHSSVAPSKLASFQTKKDKRSSSTHKLLTKTKTDNVTSRKTLPKNVLPNYEKGTANKRLDMIRQMLLKDQTKLAKHDDQTMDWQPLNLREPLKENAMAVQTVANDLIITNNNDTEDSRTMADLYDYVHDNLMRRCAEQNQTASKWHTHLSYCVLDTNILLDHMSIVKQLCIQPVNHDDANSKGTVLYIPYIVLQELDKLKLNEGLRTLSTRAIRYLNSQFELKNERLQAQSALEAQQTLIEITSPDDRIINCCLQLKQNVPQVLLLTEDVNLRNKAAANNVATCNESQLIARNENTTVLKST